MKILLSYKKALAACCLCVCLFTPPLLYAAETAHTAPSVTTREKVSTGLALQGMVLKTMDTATHTYLIVATRQGKIWLSVEKTAPPAANGQTLRIWITMPQPVANANALWSHSSGLPMDMTKAQALWQILEATIFGAEAKQKENEVKTADSPHSGTKQSQGITFADALETERNRAVPTQAVGGESAGSVGAVVPSAGVTVAKATGANSYTVEQCFTQAKALHGQTVRVHGKVMKVSRMIMGKNWLHIQDGSGDSAKHQHDLVVTTQADPSVQSIVTVEGVLSFKRDFGAGYVYEAIIEDAKVEQ